MRIQQATIAIGFLAVAAMLYALPAAAETSLRIYVSKHYEIHTDLSRIEAVPWGRHMDAMYGQYRQRFGGFTARPTGTMPLYLFRDRQGYREFLDKHSLTAEHSGGIFFVKHGIQGLATWVEDRPPAQTRAVLQHEGFHQFAWSYLGPTLPTWVNEGLAQYFEDAVLLKSGLRLGMGDPRRIETARQAVSDGKIVPCDRMLSLTPSHWQHVLQSDPESASLLYAQAWSMAYFLIHAEDGRYLPAFERYLDLLSAGGESKQAFTAAFGPSAIEGFEQRWKAFAQTQQPVPLREATDHLVFLGTALAALHQRGHTMPADLDQLQIQLVNRGFSVLRSSHGQDYRMHAEDDSLYRFEHPDGKTRPFVMLTPHLASLPPRLTAPGLDPQPTLTWRTASDGKLKFDIEYR